MLPKKDNTALETAVARRILKVCITDLVHKTNFTCSAREQTRKWRLKLTLVRLQTWSLTALGEGTKILCIKDHVRSSINDFRERIRVITNASRPFELKKKMMNNPGFYKFPRFTVAVYFTYFESITQYGSTVYIGIAMVYPY